MKKLPSVLRVPIGAACNDPKRAYKNRGKIFNSYIHTLRCSHLGGPEFGVAFGDYARPPPRKGLSDPLSAEPIRTSDPTINFACPHCAPKETPSFFSSHGTQDLPLFPPRGWSTLSSIPRPRSLLFGARPGTCSTGTGVWSGATACGRTLPPASLLSARRSMLVHRLWGAASCVSCLACQGTSWVIKHPLNTKSIAQRRRCVPKASLTAPPACPPCATRTRAACARSAGKASVAKPAPTLWGLDAIPPGSPSQRCAVRGCSAQPRETPSHSPAARPSHSVQPVGRCWICVLWGGCPS